MANRHRHPIVSEFDNTTVTPDEVDPERQQRHHFFEGVPRENRTDKSRLAERALLQGAKSGLLDDRVSVDGVEEEFPF